MRLQFHDWYSAQVTEQLSAGNGIEPVELHVPTAKMKCIGGQWFVCLVEYLSENPKSIVNGFLTAGIPWSQDKGKPVIDDEDLVDDNESEYDNNENESDPMSSDLESEDYDEDEFFQFSCNYSGCILIISTSTAIIIILTKNLFYKTTMSR